MPKAGKYDYPANDFEDCLEKVKKIYDIAKQPVVKREVAADILGMKHSSGWFNTIIGSMSQYGLIEAREGEVRITELAKTIIFGTAKESAEAKSESTKRIEVFNDIFTQYGNNPSDEQIRVFLRQKAFVDIAEVNSLSEKIGKLFKNTAPHLMPMINEEKQQPYFNEPTEANVLPKTNEQSINPLFEEFRLGQGIVIKLPKEGMKEAWLRTRNVMDIIAETPNQKNLMDILTELANKLEVAQSSQ